MSVLRIARQSLLVLACVAGLSVGFVAETAHAQAARHLRRRPGAGMGGGFTPSVTKADLKKFAAVLSLDELQTETADELLAAYQAEHDVFAKQARKDMDRIRTEFEDSQDPSVFRDEMPKVMETYREGSQKIEKQFFDDVKSLLTPQQAERLAEGRARACTAASAACRQACSAERVWTWSQRSNSSNSPRTRPSSRRCSTGTRRSRSCPGRTRQDSRGTHRRHDAGRAGRRRRLQLRHGADAQGHGRDAQGRRGSLPDQRAVRPQRRSDTPRGPPGRVCPAGPQDDLPPRVPRDSRRQVPQGRGRSSTTSAEQKSTISELLETYEAAK